MRISRARIMSGILTVVLGISVFAGAVPANASGLGDGGVRVAAVTSSSGDIFSYAQLGHDHTFPDDSGTVTRKPTETENGIMTLHCTGCSATKDVSIPKITKDTVVDGLVRIESTTKSGLLLTVAPGQAGDEGNLEFYSMDSDEVSLEDQTFLFSQNSDGTYTISWGDYVLEAYGGEVCGNLCLCIPDETDAQKWYLRWRDDEAFQLINKANWCCIDLSGGDPEDGTNACTYVNYSTEKQYFKLRRVEYKDHARLLEGRMLRKASDGDDGEMEYICPDCGVVLGSAKGKEKPVNGIYRIRSKLGTNKYVSVAPNEYKAKGNIALYSKGSAEQEFHITQNNDGTYQIITGEYAFDLDNYKTNGNISLWTNTNSAAQRWYITKEKDGYYTFTLQCTYQCMDVAAGSVADGANIGAYDYNRTDSQKFILELVERDTVIPTEITVAPSSVTMTCWDRVTLTAETNPSGAASDELIWESEDESIVKVNENGGLIPVSVGMTMVSVSSVYDETVMYTVPVTVKPVITPEIAEVDLLSGDEYRNYIALNTSAISGIICTVKDPSVASVDPDFDLEGGTDTPSIMIVGESEGETDIVLTVSGSSGEQEEFQIHVVVSGRESINTDITRIEIYRDGELITEDDEINVMTDELLELTAKIYVAGEEEAYDYSFDQSTIQTSKGRIRLIWSSTNPSVATVNRGNVTAFSAGSVFITALAMRTQVMSEVIEISVKERPIPLRSLFIGKTDPIEQGESAYLQPVFTPMNAGDKRISWESEDRSIATVNEYGMYTGVSAGKTVIHVISGENPEISGEVEVEIKPISVKSITVTAGTKETTGDGNTFADRQEVPEGGSITLRHNVDGILYLKTSVNEDAAMKAVSAEISDNKDRLTEMQDVTDSFTGLSDSEQVFMNAFSKIGNYTVDLYAMDGNGAVKNFTVRVIPYNEWIEDEDGNRYHYTEEVLDIGWTSLSGRTYYFDASGILQTGWKKIDGKWYYFGKDGVMRTGWQKIGKWYYFGSDGIMMTGWKKLGGKWYYFGKDGVLRIGWQKIGGWYYFGTDGIMRTGWQKIGKWYYFGTDGIMTTGWRKIGSSWYYFKEGVMLSGWQKIGSGWYFFIDGAMKTGWLKSGGKWYYFDKDGKMVTGRKKIGNKNYQFNSSGVCMNT